MGTKYQIRVEEEARNNYEIIPIFLFGTIFPIVIGLFLRLPKLIIEIKQNKQWTFDWIKFIAIALPTLYIISMSILPLGGSIKIPEYMINGNPTILIIAGTVFGFTLLDSLKK
ncbi:hypothetical protein [Oceanobacillus arenosus]|uniref:hypothetical protein n=1 Tax=Oceanobacillus arenosus TaxID=1229153 RepID=UPI001FEB8401|nr:hypothetical protein [Oceanobacillus arenosus]